MDNNDQNRYNLEYYTVAQFADILNISKRTVLRAIWKGKLQALNVGQGSRKAWRIPKSEIGRIALFDLKEMIKTMISNNEI